MKCIKLMSALVALFATFALWAVEVTSEQACIAVQNWISKNPKRMTAKFATSAAYADDVQTSKNAAGRALYHVVSLMGGGYVVTAGDTQLPPVIAFSESGYLDLMDIENPMCALLERDMGRRIEFVDGGVSSSGLKMASSNEASPFEAEWAELIEGQSDGTEADGKADAAKTSLSSLSDVRVAPMVQSKWGQSTWNGYNTFNYYTPNNYVCGCVATAFAQIMRYWQKPTASVAARTYYCAVDDVICQKTMIGGTYSWSDMPLTSGSCTSATQRQAIGKLLYDVCVASHMKWADDGSGTMGFAASQALRNTFGYASSQAYFDVTGYGLQTALASQAAFRDAILASLDAGMPCAVGVGGDNGGHEMVLDGYGFSGSVIYSHINCGWSGSEDAWYNFFGEYVTSYSFGYMDELGYNIHPTVNGDVLSGRVLNASGAAVSGATVTLTFGSSTKTATTNAKGIYHFRITSAGTYMVSASYGSQVGSTTATVLAMSVSTTAAVDNNLTYDKNSSNGTLGNKWGVDLTLGNSAPTGDAYDPGDDTPTGGTWLTPSTTVQTHGPHTLSSTDKYDFFRISMTAGRKYVFESTGSYDMYGELFSSTSTNSAYRVDYDDDSGDDRNFKIEYTPTVSQTYYLRIRRYTVGEEGTYSLKYSYVDGAPPVTLTIGDAMSMTKTYSSASAQSGEFSVQCNSSWTVSKNVSWITLSATSGSGNGTVSFSLTANTSTSSRTGTITVSSGNISRTCTVTQAGASTPPASTYTIKFNKNDGSGATATRTFTYGVSTSLPTISALGWTRSGYTFKGWATSAAKASAGTVWKTDGAKVATPVAAGQTLVVYAIWASNASQTYTIKFHKNDGSGSVATRTFTYNVSTSLPTIGSLGWTRGGYTFRGWATSAEKASAGTVWKTDGAKVATPVAAGQTLVVYAIWAASDNDNFVNAIKITGSSGNVTGSNVSATSQSGEPLLSYSSPIKTVWWVWTAPSSGTVTFSTSGSSFDTVMGIYKGTALSSLVEACPINDDYSGTASQCSFSAVPGTSYRIVVGGFGGAAGTIKLSWSMTAANVSVRSVGKASSWQKIVEAAQAEDSCFLSGVLPDGSGAYDLVWDEATGEGYIRIERDGEEGFFVCSVATNGGQYKIVMIETGEIFSL